MVDFILFFALFVIFGVVGFVGASIFITLIALVGKLFK